MGRPAVVRCDQRAGVQALTDSTVEDCPSALHLIVLAVWGAVMSAASVRLFSWE